MVIAVWRHRPKLTVEVRSYRRFFEHFELAKLGEPLHTACRVTASHKFVLAGGMDENVMTLLHRQADQRGGRI